MTRTQLRQLLLGALASAGCGGFEDRVPEEEFEPLPCGGVETSPWLSGMAWAGEVEGAQLWVNPEAGWSVVEGTEPTCTEGEEAGCMPRPPEEELSRSDLMFGALVQVSERMALVLRGPEGQEVVGDRERLLEKIGPVDSWSDAVLVALSGGYDVGCGDVELGGFRASGRGSEVLGRRWPSTCKPMEERRYQLLVREDAEIEVLANEIISSEEHICAGRRPEGLRPISAEAAGARARWVGEMAGLEGAAVVAFARLEEELRGLGAPPSLLSGLRRAQREERRHARRVGRVARGMGARLGVVEVEPVRAREAEDIALENAVEGCAREAWGALVAGWMSARCPQPTLRHELRRIARDEARHAELSWAVAAWLEPRLDAAARARVQAARERALVGLGGEEGPLQRALGLPNTEEGQRLLQGLASLCQQSAAALA